LKRADWKRIFSQGIIDRVLAEHVIEHWTVDEFRLFLGIVRPFLSQQGFIRLAVPDGFHPDPSYIDHVKPGWSRSGTDDHKALYNYESLKEQLEKAGFAVKLLEYWDERGNFHFKEWFSEDGHVRRSKRYDPRNQDGSLTYTSLIVDAMKP
jgi:predicted SAM-dependent methyltransferase